MSGKQVELHLAVRAEAGMRHTPADFPDMVSIYMSTVSVQHEMGLERGLSSNTEV